MSREAAVLALQGLAASGALRNPGVYDRVYGECAFSFDTAETKPSGIYISPVTFLAYGKHMLKYDNTNWVQSGTGGARVYLHQTATRVPKRAEEKTGEAAEETAPTLPSKLGIGVPGGFAAFDEAEWEWEKHADVVVFVGDEEIVFDDFSALPSPLPAVFAAIMSSAAAEAAHSNVPWEDAPMVSKYADGLTQLNNGVKIRRGGEKGGDGKSVGFQCNHPGCDINENLWLNLSDGFIGCGRAQVGGSRGEGHALAHYHACLRASPPLSAPLVVKLGTITPHGTADVYSYAPDENDTVLDPHLASHLSHWGINVQDEEKTESSISELSVALNANYDFSRIAEAGKDLKPATGKGFIGLDNLGNTCYLNSAVQVLSSLPEVAALYGGDLEDARVTNVYRTAGRAPTDDLLTQTVKLIAHLTGSAGERYALDEKSLNKPKKEIGPDGRPVKVAGDETSPEPGAGGTCGFLAPRLFKTVIGKSHREFATNKQQDVVEFLEWLLQQLERAQNAPAAQARLPPLHDGTHTLSDLFSFLSEQRLSDGQSGAVRYGRTKEALLRLNIPLDLAVNRAEVETASSAVDAAAAAADAAAGIVPASEDFSPDGNAAKRAKIESGDAGKKLVGVRTPGDRLRAELAPTIPKLRVPFDVLFSAFRAPTVVDGFRSPLTGALGSAVTSVGFASFPRYLLVVLNRYEITSDYSIKKIDASVPMPLDFDLSDMKSNGLQPGEEDLDAIVPAASSSAAGPTVLEEPNPMLISMLMDAGFPEGACKRAAMATGNGDDVEAAMNWVLGHMDDSDFAAPYVPPAPASSVPAPAAGGDHVDPSVLEMLVAAMGFDEKRARYALKQTNGDAERAADWLFSHSDDPLPDEAPVGGAGVGVARQNAPFETADAAARGKYSLVGFMSHMGGTTMSGHYVCHIRKDAASGRGEASGRGQWYIFNDSKVAVSEEPPLDLGFVYVYKRME
jgi:ubiquitin carboxyl-terminal hydrolase 5/13